MPRRIREKQWKKRVRGRQTEPAEQEGGKELKISIATCSIRMEKVMFLTVKLHHTKKVVAATFVLLLILRVS